MLDNPFTVVFAIFMSFWGESVANSCCLVLFYEIRVVVDSNIYDLSKGYRQPNKLLTKRYQRICFKKRFLTSLSFICGPYQREVLIVAWL